MHFFFKPRCSDPRMPTSTILGGRLAKQPMTMASHFNLAMQRWGIECKTLSLSTLSLICPNYGLPTSFDLRTMHADTRPQSRNDGPTPMEIDDENEKLEEKVEKAKEDSKRREKDVEVRCIICNNPWEREGPHQTCCLPCGHLYGLSCIEKFITLAAKCPECNVRCNLNDVTKLFALPTILLDQNLEKENKELKVENLNLVSLLQSAESRTPSPCQASGSASFFMGFGPVHVKSRFQFCDVWPKPLEIGVEEETLEEKVKKAKEESKRTEKEVEYSDSFRCIFCTNPWEREGPHRICCLPCGHLYGLSCIAKWIIGKAIAERAGTCPQCNVRCNLIDAIKLLGLPAILLDQNLEKDNKLLKYENEKMVSLLLSVKSTTPPCPGFW